MKVLKNNETYHYYKMPLFWLRACVAVVSISFKPSGVSARGHWAKRSKKGGAGGRGGEGKETPAAEPRHFTERRLSANGRQ